MSHWPHWAANRNIITWYFESVCYVEVCLSLLWPVDTPGFREYKVLYNYVQEINYLPFYTVAPSVLRVLWGRSNSTPVITLHEELISIVFIEHLKVHLRQQSSFEDRDSSIFYRMYFEVIKPEEFCTLSPLHAFLWGYVILLGSRAIEAIIKLWPEWGESLRCSGSGCLRSSRISHNSWSRPLFDPVTYMHCITSESPDPIHPVRPAFCNFMEKWNATGAAKI